MVGRKLSTVALAGSIAIVAIAGGCRDQATTGPGTIGNGAFASDLQLLQGDGQTGGVAAALPVSLIVKVVDAGGTPVSGGSVRWSVISGGGSVTPPTGVSDANGLVSTAWTLGSALGANRVRAYLTNGYVVDSADFIASAVSGPPVVITLGLSSVPPPTVRVGTTLAGMQYLVVDAFGFPVAGATVSFGTGFGSGTVTPTSALTSADGHVSTSWTLGTAVGTQSVSATLAGQLPLTSVVTATPDTSRRIAILTGDGQTSAVNSTLPITMTVQVTDRFNNVIVGDNVIFNDSLGNGSVMTPFSAFTDASGVAATSWQLGAIAGVQKVRVRTPGSGGQFVRFTATAALSFRDVFVGNFFTCGIATNDRAYCWGFGDDGELGLGPTPATPRRSRSTPTWPVTQSDTLNGPYPTFRSVSGGKSHACGNTIARQLMCWGANPDLRAFTIPSPAGSQFAVTPSPAVASVRSLGAGDSFSCYTTLGGVLFCSGTNEVGETGFANPFSSVSPAGTGWATVAAGQRHTCAMPRFDPTTPLTVAASSTPYCWGLNDNGQLGDGLATYANSAVAVKVVLPGGVGIDSTTLVAGAAHTCGIATGGVAYCWGSNAFGQLGTNGAMLPGARNSTPVAVPGTFTKLYAGEYHTCGIATGGAAMCWGRNSSGQLGNNSTSNSAVPVAVFGGRLFTALALGETHTCGIVGTITGAAGELLCWGGNEFGQLGIGVFSVPTSLFPTPQHVFYQQ